MVYVTNAVKHFKHEQRSKRRLRSTRAAPEIEACRWWIERELAIVRPRIALGVTAATSHSGRLVVLSRAHGQILAFGEHKGMATMHPSAVLRAIDPAERMRLESMSA